jgi:hypothetical protein
VINCVLWACFGGAPPLRGITFTTCKRNLNKGK